MLETASSKKVVGESSGVGFGAEGVSPSLDGMEEISEERRFTVSSLINVIAQQLGGDTLGKMSSQLGADEKATGSAVSAALPLILKALARNASNDNGAHALSRALTKDHDGSILDSLGDFLKNPQAGPGEGILGHVFGSKLPTVERGLSQSSGMDTADIGKLMGMLAPIVMGALGKAQRQQNLDSRSLAGYLNKEEEALERKEPQTMGVLGKLLDADRDGDVDMGDLARHGFGMLGKFFRR